jgi:hypothetical protein
MSGFIINPYTMAATAIPIIGLDHSSNLIAYSITNAHTFDESTYTMPVSGQGWSGMAYDGANLVSVSNTGDSNKYAAVSTDKGKTWATKTLPVVATWSDVATNGTGTFVAVGTTSAPNQAVAISTDHGQTWAVSNLGANFLPQAIAWNGSVFCLVGWNTNSTATSICYTSPDGANNNWTARTMHDTKFWTRICWSGVKFVANDSGGFGTACNTSADAITWAAGGAPPASTVFSGIVSNGTRVVSCCGDNSGNACYSDDNGATWNVTSFATSSTFNRMAWNGTVFVAARNGVINYSADGASGWTAVTTTASFGPCIGSAFLTFGTF